MSNEYKGLLQHCIDSAPIYKNKDLNDNFNI